LFRLTLRNIAFVLAVVVCLVLASLLLPGLAKDRARFSISEDVLEQMPPELVIATTALGGFRGLLVDAVWLRARNLLIEGKFWELVQLYDWIGKLEPHHEKIWTFNAWNMAYNIVAKLKDSEERFQWVWRAIESLRDQGLRYNPRSLEIHRELAWLFFQKLGRETDEHHRYYKHRMALTVMEKLRVPGLNLRMLSLAPRSREDLNLMLLDRAGEEMRWFFDVHGDTKYFDVVARYEEMGQKKPEDFPEDKRRRMDQPNFVKSWQTIENFLLAERIRKEFRLDPQRMYKLERKYGPMDWRLPDPHAIYWATMGLEKARALPLKEKIKLHRIILFSLKQLYRRGTISYMERDPYGRMLMTYNIWYIDPVDQLYRDLIKQYSGSGQELASEFVNSMKDGHKYHLQESLFILYFGGPSLEKEANRYFQKLQKDYPSDRWKNVPLHHYMIGQIKDMVEEWGTEAQMKSFTENLLVQALLHFGLGESDKGVMYEQWAKRAWEWFRKDFVMAKGDKPGTEKTKVAHFDELYREVLAKTLAGNYPHVPPPVVKVLNEMFKLPGDKKKPDDGKDRSLRELGRTDAAE